MRFIAKLVSLLLIPNMCFGEITRVQTAKGNVTGGTSCVVTLGSSPTDGNFIVLGLGKSTSIFPTSVSQTGATWVQATGIGSGPSNQIWYAENVSGAGTTITVSFTAALSAVCIATEYSGIALSSSLDQTATATGTDPDNPETGTTATTSVPFELWFGAISVNSSVTFTSPSNSFSIIDQDPITGLTTTTLERIVSAVGTAQTSVSFAIPPLAYSYSGGMATFKAFRESGVQLMTDVGLGG